MQGPPAVLYFIQSEPTKEHYMAMAQTYFLLHYRLCRVCILLRSFITIRFIIQRASAAPTFGKIFKALVDLLQE